MLIFKLIMLPFIRFQSIGRSTATTAEVIGENLDCALAFENHKGSPNTI